jgi:RNA polymerase sigma factor (sigma-70 family)
MAAELLSDQQAQAIERKRHRTPAERAQLARWRIGKIWGLGATAPTAELLEADRDRLSQRRRFGWVLGSIEARQRDWMAGDGIAQALDTLDARSRRIVEERWLKVNDDASGGMTLHELAAEYGVSAERIRQIEVAAMKKMRKAIEAAV